jgi:hypothetical protein
MYTITVDDTQDTAETILEALTVLATRLRAALTRHDRARWTVTGPGGVDHLGIHHLNGRLDRLDESVDDTCEELYNQLHRAADGGPPRVRTT